MLFECSDICETIAYGRNWGSNSSLQYVGLNGDTLTRITGGETSGSDFGSFRVVSNASTISCQALADGKYAFVRDSGATTIGDYSANEVLFNYSVYGKSCWVSVARIE